jgi:hypothetical protein
MGVHADPVSRFSDIHPDRSAESGRNCPETPWRRACDAHRLARALRLN